MPARRSRAARLRATDPGKVAVPQKEVAVALARQDGYASPADPGHKSRGCHAGQPLRLFQQSSYETCAIRATYSR